LSDAPLRDCPECGKPELSKMVTAAGFHLKGSGWYATDFKHGAAAQAKATDKTEAKSDDKAAVSADAKPAADKPAKKADAPAAKATPAATPAAGS
jgi:hypothetical protein